jgi:hypothetical protein
MNKPPQQFCESGARLGAGVESCAGNKIFMQAAEQCWKKLEDLEKRVTKELETRIGMKNAAPQNATFQNTKSTYNEGTAALEYMYEVTTLAMKEIDDYFDRVVYPEHSESDEETMSEGCYRDVVVPMDELADKFQEKQVDIVSRIESAEEKATAMTGKDTEIDTAAGAHTDLKAAPAAKGPKGKGIRSSDISGTEDKKKK